MKTTFTMMTAAAALIAAFSIASAQTSTMPKSGSTSPSDSSMTMGTGKFCIGTTGSTLNCKYASLSECQKDVTGSQTCSPNPKSGTTGAK